jgi:hypothetical protein
MLNAGSGIPMSGRDNQQSNDEAFFKMANSGAKMNMMSKSAP